MRGVRAVGLVLVDEGRCGVLLLVDVIGGAENAIRSRLHRCAGQHHEIGRAARNEARIIRLQRDEDDVVAALGHQIQAVVEELPEEGHPGIEGRRQAGIGRDIRDEMGLGVVGCAEQSIQARAGDRGRTRGLRGGRHGRRVIGGLVDDQVADGARLGVDHGAAGLCVGGPRLRRTECRIQQAREEIVRRAEFGLPLHQVVERAIEGAQTERHLHVGEQVTEVLAGGMGFGDENLLEDEIQVRQVEVGHFADSSIPTA
ncbi:hypothetical protein D3C84_552890 [compost metagenome]